MKKLIVLLIAIVPLFCLGQEIINFNTKEIKELQEETLHYSKITIETAGFKLAVSVGIDEGGIYRFHDSEAKKGFKQFKTDLEVLNYMYAHGWQVKERIPSTGTMMFYLMEKRSIKPLTQSATIVE